MKQHFEMVPIMKALDADLKYKVYISYNEQQDEKYKSFFYHLQMYFLASNRLREVCRSDGQIRQKFDRSDKNLCFSRTKCPPLSRTEYPCLPMSILGFLVLFL